VSYFSCQFQRGYKNVRLEKGKEIQIQHPLKQVKVVNIFVEELKEIYFTEKALLISIPVLIKNAVTDELADALQSAEIYNRTYQTLKIFFNSIGKTYHAAI
jgi:ferritin-like metal-binding protein YciE